MKTRRKAGLTAISALAVVGLAGWDNKISEPFHDAPRGQTNDAPADIITMPDGFNNVAAKCDGPNRVYALFHSDSAYGGIAVAPNDPLCSK